MVAELCRQAFFCSCLVLDKIVPARGVPVLLYHSIDESGSPASVSPTHFAEQMNYLARGGWVSISIDQLVASIQSQSLPKKRLVITFDDGFQNVITEALPVLESLGFTATVFAATGYIGGRNSYVKSRMPDLPMLTWQELRILKEHGWQIESHGHSHTDLPLLNSAQLHSELQISREQIQKEVGVCPRHFCYPRGKYTPSIEDTMREAGYESSMSVQAGLATTRSNLWRLERLWVSDTTLLHFRALLTQPYCWCAAFLRSLQ